MGRRDVWPMRQWNTWLADRPLAFACVPSGLVVAPAVYSTRAGAGCAFRVGEPAEVRLGAHDPEGRFVRAEAAFAGTRLAFRWAKADSFTWVADWRYLELGEWPLRHWLVWAAWFEGGRGSVAPGPAAAELGRGRAAPGRGGAGHGPGAHVTATWRSQAYALVTDPPPLAAGRAESLAAILAELSAGGYFAPRGESGAAAVLRYCGEACPEGTLALAVAHDPEQAERRARRALDDAAAIRAEAEAALRRGPHLTVAAKGGDGPLDAAAAVRDVVAWNTVWDPVNERDFTCLTRNWMATKFGGWFVWLDDVLHHGLLAAMAGDGRTARRNVEVALSGQTPDGNLPCLLAENTEWVDRSQPPIAAWVTEQVAAWADDPALLRDAYPVLAAAHEWWFAHRDPRGDGLIAYGSSRAGSGMFVGTALAARDESSMDNSPLYDGVPFDAEARTLRLWDVAPSSLLVLEAQCLARLAAARGEAAAAERLRARGDRLAERVRQALWDDRLGLFRCRAWPATDGGAAPWAATSPTSFFPLLAGIATPEQARRMVEEHLRPAGRFGGEPMLPATPRDEPGYADQTYWRGRVWPPLVFLTYLGLRRYGYDDDARLVAERSVALFRREWESRRHCHENYHGDSGEGDDGADSDPFYSWGALMPALALLEAVCWTAWDGLTLGTGGPAASARGIRLLGRVWDVTQDGAGLAVSVDGRPVIRAAGPSRLFEVTVAEGRVGFTVRSGEGAAEVALADGRLVAGEGGAVLTDAGGWSRLTWRGASRPLRLVVEGRPD